MVRALTEYARRRSTILCHHGVGVSAASDDPFLLRVRPLAFRAQLELLLDAGFRFVTAGELVSMGRGGDPPAGHVAVTFDDGMEDNHALVAPLMREYGLPWTVFVTTGLIGGPNPAMSERSRARMMTRDQIRELSHAGVEIGAHSVTHPDLAQLDREDCLREVTASRATLEEITSAPVGLFAYPYGNYGPAALAAVADAGYDAAFTIGHERGSWRPFEIKRAVITGKDGLPVFVSKVSETYGMMFDSMLGRTVRVATRGARSRMIARAARP